MIWPHIHHIEGFHQTIFHLAAIWKSDGRYGNNWIIRKSIRNTEYRHYYNTRIINSILNGIFFFFFFAP